MRIAFRLLLGLGLIFSLPGCNPDVDMELREPIRPVRTVVAEQGDNFLWRVYFGTLQADFVSKLSFRVGGVIDSFSIELGQQVDQGQLIASINNNDLDLKLDREKAALLQAKAEEANARMQYERAYGLVERGVVSQNEYESSDTLYRTSRAELERAKKSVELAKKQFDYAKLKVPMKDCTVSDLAAEIGENVTAGQVIATLNCGEHFEVLTHVSENAIREISVGDEVVVRLNIYQDKEYRGIVSEVGAAVGNRATYPVIVRIVAPDDRLRVGMAAEVSLKIALDPSDTGIAVPFSAVGEDSNGRFVYRFNSLPAEGEQDNTPIGTAERVSVTVGKIVYQGILITDGISEGDRIITAGLRYLTDGRKVKLLNSEESSL